MVIKNPVSFLCVSTFTGYFQVYEALLYFTSHPDHNVVTASLETLQQLLRNTPLSLLKILITPGSIRKTSVYQKDLSALMNRIPSKNFFSLSVSTLINSTVVYLIELFSGLLEV